MKLHPGPLFVASIVLGCLGTLAALADKSVESAIFLAAAIVMIAFAYSSGFSK